MFNLNVNINPEAFKEVANKQCSLLIQHLKDKNDKTFKIVVHDIEYVIRYEIINNDIQLFVQNENADDQILIEPSLTLNLGAWLLPESQALDVLDDSDTEGYNPAVNIDSVKELVDQELSPIIINKIYSQIINKGFINIINL